MTNPMHPDSPHHAEYIVACVKAGDVIHANGNAEAAFFLHRKPDVEINRAVVRRLVDEGKLEAVGGWSPYHSFLIDLPERVEESHKADVRRGDDA